MTSSTSAITATHRYDIPHLEPRRRSDDHPMAMFGLIVAVAFGSMAFLSLQASAKAGVEAASLGTGEPVTTTKAARLPVSDKDKACRGQAWGAESVECLREIAKDGGKTRLVRVVLADQINSTAPNVF